MPKHIALTSVALQPLPTAGDDFNSTVLALRTLGSFDFQGKPFSFEYFLLELLLKIFF